MAKEELKSVERLEMMEEKIGVNFTGVYAEYERFDQEGQYITVRGEVVAINATTIEDDIRIVMTAYNNDGKVICSGEVWILAENFFGISPFCFSESVIEKPVKIRVYPVKG